MDNIITLKKNKPNLYKTFNEYLENEESRYSNLFSTNEYLDYFIRKYCKKSKRKSNSFDFDDDYYDYTSNKKGRKNKKAKRKCHPLYDDYEFNDDELIYSKKRNRKKKSNKLASSYDDDFDNKTIYFYNDFINNPDDVVEFCSIYEFDKFLEEKGINISSEEIKNIKRREITHCCVNPEIQAKEKRVELITDSSFGSLFWQCSNNVDDINFN